MDGLQLVTRTRRDMGCEDGSHIYLHFDSEYLHLCFPSCGKVVESSAGFSLNNPIAKPKKDGETATEAKEEEGKEKRK